MKIKQGETTLKINMSFAAVVTFMLILDESGLCALSLFCCIVHELGHIICLVLLGEKPRVIELSFYGVRLERNYSYTSTLEDVLVFVSGPAANIILSAVLFIICKYEGIKTAAVISLCVGLFNLIPCRPLDGGNIIYSILCKIMNEEISDKICFYISLFLLVPMVFVGLLMIIKGGNYTLIAVTVYLLWLCYVSKKKFS